MANIEIWLNDYEYELEEEKRRELLNEIKNLAIELKRDITPDEFGELVIKLGGKKL